MYATKQTAKRREALTLIELLVVIAIILAVAALAAAFAPRVSDSTNLSRSVDQMEQWLLTAKMRAKRDGLATGIRFIQVPGDLPNTFSQVQYIQQPDSLSGAPGGGVLFSAGLLLDGKTSAPGQVNFANVDFTLGGAALVQGLVQPGDYLEIRDGGIFLIRGISNATTLQLGSINPSAYFTTASGLTPPGYLSAYENNLLITTPTMNYRILRQPRILIGETPLDLPNNYAVDFNNVPSTAVPGTNVINGPSGFPEILFSPTGAVVGSNAANSLVLMYIHDVTQDPVDPNKAGIVSIQTRTGFIGAYSVAPGANPFAFAQSGRESGL